MTQVKKGAILSYLSIAVSLVVTIAYTPVMIRLLGQEEYGLFVLIGSVIVYFSKMDLGLGNAVIRYISRNRAIGDKKSEAMLSGNFLLLYSLASVFVLVVGFVIYSNATSIFGGSLTNNQIEKAEIMILIITITFIFALPMQIFRSIVKAYERFATEKIITIISNVSRPVIILIFLFNGYGVIAMIAITSVLNILTLVYFWYYTHFYLEVRVKLGKVDFSIMKEILVYSSFIFLNIIVDQIYWQTDQIILGIVAGTIPVAVLGIAMQFIRVYLMFSTAMSGLFLPRVSRIATNGKDNSAELSSLFIKIGRIQFLILSYIFGGFVLVGKPFIEIWAGPSYGDAYYIVIILMIALIVPLTQNVGISILQAYNLHAFRSIALIIMGVVNIIITVPLAERYLGIGTAIATAGSLLIVNILVMNIYYYKKLNLDIFGYWKNIFILMVSSTSSMLVSFLIGLNIHFNNFIAEIIINGIIFTVIYSLIQWKFSMNVYEKSLFISIKNRFDKNN
ncbi:oligosaccharide flippase family protein [Salimicrobium salexigens]|uniref:Membrane protein involved in the export of O-antigen and teichoic acid n=1 Tax=Salimicrobium salexigens TaxID=908941 RepID=A0ABY1KXK0_9BACI|nr:oligosaccharide flippase family protein [Salimicrobium salexigens]SIS82917.1 Membrane protein involved in the export of O-antigen and teichoic acid [Salimicrobium salexigens]